MLLTLTLLLAPAQAADLWFGGSLDAALDLSPGSLSVPTMGEVDFRMQQGKVFVRVDVDLWTDLASPSLLQPYPPEWAMVQVGTEGPIVRAGIHNPNIGLEDWDYRNNYMPTYSNYFNGASPGRLLGAEFAWHFENDAEVFVWGGSDMDFGWSEGEVLPEPYWTAGVGVSAEAEMWSTWTGFVTYPQDGFYALFYSGEVYPHNLVTVALDGGAGVSAGSPFAGGQLVVVGMPEATVNPTVRGEVNLDPDLALGSFADTGVYRSAVSAGGKVTIRDWLQVMAEGKLMWSAKEAQMSPGVFVALNVFRPEPGYYTAVYDEE